MAWSMRNAKRRWKGVKFKDTPMGRKWLRRLMMAVIRYNAQLYVGHANFCAIRSTPAGSPAEKARKSQFLAQAVIDTHQTAAEDYKRTMRGEI